LAASVGKVARGSAFASAGRDRRLRALGRHDPADRGRRASGVTAPLAAILLWGRFAAPKSPRRLSTRLRVPFELAVFALATVALVAADADTAAIVFGSAAVVNAVGLVLLRQLEA
jgi:hypothetical protein